MMVPPTLHQMYPLLEVEYDDPLLPPNDKVSKRRSRDPYIPRTWFITLNLCRTNIVVENL